MPWEPFIRSVTLLVVLLNPFLMVVYLLSIIREMDRPTFRRVMLRGSLISIAVFAAFAVLGDRLFTDVLQVRFSAFLVFGGVVFLLIALRFIFRGTESIEMLRGSPDHVAGAIAMPFMIGPGTINAAVLAGSALPIHWAVLAIALGVLIVALSVMALKWLHDIVSARNSDLVERYVDLTGRVSALVIGAISVEMIFQGVERWLQSVMR